MRVLVCGDRNWIRADVIEQTLHLLKLTVGGGIEVVIHGGARGADLIGASVAATLGIPVKQYLADWRKYGRAAGPIRNELMLTDGKPDIVLAFHNDICNSKGTKNMLKLCEQYGVLYRLVTTTKSDGEL